MSLSNNDLFVVQRGNSLYKVKSKALKNEYAAEAQVFVGANPPNDPVQGTLWWSTLEGNLFIWYGPDPSGSQQWVDASPAFIEINYELIAEEIYKLYDGEVVTSVSPGSNITVSGTRPGNKGDVIVNVDPNYTQSVQDHQDIQDERISQLEVIVRDLADRLDQLQDNVEGSNRIDGGYPNAIGEFTQPDTDGGNADPASMDDPLIDGGSAAGYD